MSTETKWTPGPWSLGLNDYIKSSSGEYVALVCADSQTMDANAILIAASPKLYEALDSVLDAYGLGDKGHLEIYEAAAADFYKLTRRMAPGKDSSPQAYVSEDHQAETSRMWGEFCVKRRDDAFVAARTALASARGES